MTKEAIETIACDVIEAHNFIMGGTWKREEAIKYCDLMCKHTAELEADITTIELDIHKKHRDNEKSSVAKIKQETKLATIEERKLMRIAKGHYSTLKNIVYNVLK
jgi:hypothetical protein